MQNILPKMDGSLFDWIAWSAGTIHDLGISCRYPEIIRNGYILRELAIGWCRGEEVVCRQKLDMIAVMFCKNEKEFWFHLRLNEFEEVFEMKIGKYLEKTSL